MLISLSCRSLPLLTVRSIARASTPKRGRRCAAAGRAASYPLPAVVALAFIPLLHGRRLCQTGFALEESLCRRQHGRARALRLGQAATS